MLGLLDEMAPTRVISCPSLVLYGMRAAIIDLSLHGSHPYAIKNQRKARNAPSRVNFDSKSRVGSFGCLELILYGRAIPRIKPRH